MNGFQKFIPFTKVDSVRREVSGIVTAEVPDKDKEVCDYEKSLPYYKAWSAEFVKATEGASCGNLREMHQLRAVGKGTDIRFNDAEKEIEMTFKVVDEDAWQKVLERVYTGFSQGGRKVEQNPDPVFKGCQRYVANPSEVSLVDNPCLPTAHFAFVRADGAVEMRKFLRVEQPDSSRIAVLEQQVSVIKTSQDSLQEDLKHMTEGQPFNKEKKTKRVAGEDLLPSAFAYVGDPERTETWKLPIKFSTEEKTKRHIRNALARFSHTQGIPDSEKSKVHEKIKAAARKHGIDVAEEADKIAAVLATMRKAARVYVNRHIAKITSPRLRALDSELGKLTKGMREVSQLAWSIEGLSSLVYCVCCEQEWEGDDTSQVPEMLRDNIEDLTQCLLEMVQEETRELNEEIAARVD